jgi:hypothetical protein
LGRLIAFGLVDNVLEQINKLKPNKPWLAMAMDFCGFAQNMSHITLICYSV